MVAAASTGAVLGAAGIGALGNIAGGFLSNAVSYSSNKKLAKLQAALNYYYAKKSAKEMPSFNREGLESAGYNPMLAVQNATSGANSSWTSASGVGNPDFGHLGSDAISNAFDVQRLENETNQTNSNVAVNESQSRKNISEAVGQEIHNKYLNDREEKELNKLGSEVQKLNRETDYFDALEQNMLQERRLQELGIIMGFKAQKYNADTVAETMRGTIETRLPFLGTSKRYYEKDDINRMKQRGYKSLHNDYDNKDYWHYY